MPHPKAEDVADRFDIQVAAQQPFRGGDPVECTAVARADLRDNHQMSLVYRDNSGIGATFGSIDWRAPIRAGEAISTTFVLPPQPLSAYSSRLGVFRWEVRVAETRRRWPFDLVVLDVANGRHPDPDAPPVDLRRGRDTFSFLGRGRKTKRWDVEAVLRNPECARGGQVVIDLTVGDPRPERTIEVGLRCTEYWFVWDRDLDDGSRSERGKQAVLYESFEPVAARSGRIELDALRVPVDGPFSWHRPDQVWPSFNSGFSWEVVVREGHPRRGPEKRADLTVCP